MSPPLCPQLINERCCHWLVLCFPQSTEAATSASGNSTHGRTVAYLAVFDLDWLVAVEFCHANHLAERHKLPILLTASSKTAGGGAHSLHTGTRISSISIWPRTSWGPLTSADICQAPPPAALPLPGP